MVKYNIHLAQASPGDSQGQALAQLHFTVPVYCKYTVKRCVSANALRVVMIFDAGAFQLNWVNSELLSANPSGGRSTQTLHLKAMQTCLPVSNEVQFSATLPNLKCSYIVLIVYQHSTVVSRHKPVPYCRLLQSTISTIALHTVSRPTLQHIQ